MKNQFENKNVIHWLAWLFQKTDELNLVSIYFLSRRNSTSPRYLDRVYLKLIPKFIRIFRWKFEKYNAIFLFGLGTSATPRMNQILHFDDPEYTEEELNDILIWESKVKQGGHKTAIVCTGNFTQQFLIKNGSASDIFVISQGHNSSKSQNPLQGSNGVNQNIRFVYTSPYIHSRGDLHEGHINWDVSDFLQFVVPSILERSSMIEIHLIGHVGENARQLLPPNERVVVHGFLDFNSCSSVLETCHVGLYPRLRDNFRQAQKISEYIGAGLAILSYDLVDASLVKELEVGLVSSSREDFIDKALELANNRYLLEKLRLNSRKNSPNLSWKYLAKSLESLSAKFANR
mgnify:CR=1 FL=1